MESAGQCGSCTETRDARGASCSKVRWWLLGAGTALTVGLTHRLPTARGTRGPVDVVVGDTDYRGFAVLYLERARQLSVKLYGTSRGSGSACPQGCWVGWVGPLLPPPCPCPPAQMWGQNGTGKWGSRGGLQPPERPAGPAPWVPRSPCVPHTVRSLPVGDSFLSVFEQRVQGANLTEDHTLFFPKYGECPSLPVSPRLAARPLPPAAPDPWPGPQVSARPRTSSTPWTVSGQLQRAAWGGGAQGPLPAETHLCCRSAEVRRAAALCKEGAGLELDLPPLVHRPPEAAPPPGAPWAVIKRCSLSCCLFLSTTEHRRGVCPPVLLP